MSSDLLALGAAILLLLVNAFFVGAEFALISARRDRLESMARAGTPGASTVLRAGAHLSRMLAGAQLGITICSLLLGRLGEPYLSTRAGASNHMGLGIFIAQSLLERSGADLTFDNLVDGGAHVVISWNRANLEADARPDAAAAGFGSDGARQGNERQTV